MCTVGLTECESIALKNFEGVFKFRGVLFGAYGRFWVTSGASISGYHLPTPVESSPGDQPICIPRAAIVEGIDSVWASQIAAPVPDALGVAPGKG